MQKCYVIVHSPGDRTASKRLISDIGIANGDRKDIGKASENHRNWVAIPTVSDPNSDARNNNIKIMSGITRTYNNIAFDDTSIMAKFSGENIHFKHVLKNI